MPQRENSTGLKGFLRAWLAEWPKMAAALTVAFLVFAIPLAFTPIRLWLWPPGVVYPVICTAEPVWRGGDKRLVEIYVINTAPEDLSGEQLNGRLRAALGKDFKGASPAVMFPYRPGETHAESAVADTQFNEGKGELAVTLDDHGVRVEPERMAALAILRANVVFPAGDDSVEYSRGAKLTAGMFDLTKPEHACYSLR